MSVPNDSKAVRRQYATDEALKTRQAIHDKYTVPKVSYADWVLDSVAWRGDEVVLDIGSASGPYYQPLMARAAEARYVALDYSAGMLQKNNAQYRVQGDGQQLPFREDVFDVVMANHMLYHLEDIEAAIKEFRRVLKPGGLLMVATNSTQSMPELQVLMRRAILLLARAGTTQIQPPTPASDRFALENGTRYLARHFYAVMRHDLPSKLIFPEIDPIMDYLESTRTLREPQLPEGVAWDDVMMIMRQQIAHLINHLGELVITKLVGVLIATDNGGFIQQFTDIKGAVGVTE
ncbi:MAG: class I SAM-dependent methyltransferase [Chloroflexota bacterium]